LDSSSQITSTQVRAGLLHDSFRGRTFVISMTCRVAHCINCGGCVGAQRKNATKEENLGNAPMFN
jgi:hypothetical protein